MATKQACGCSWSSPTERLCSGAPAWLWSLNADHGPPGIWLAWWLPKGIPGELCAALPSPAQEAATGPLAVQSCIEHQPPTRTQSHMAEIKCCYSNSMLFSVKSATSTMLEFWIHPRLARPSALAAADQTNFAHTIAVETQFVPF